MNDTQILQGVELTALLLLMFLAIPAIGSRRWRFVASAGAVALFTAMAVTLVPMGRWLAWFAFVQDWWWIASVGAIIVLLVAAFADKR